MNNKEVVLITGGSSGIGKATALKFAQSGARLAISYKDNQLGAEAVASNAKALGAEVVVIQADLSQDSDAKRLVSSVINSYGKLDILVNNAGRYLNGDDWQGQAEIWFTSIKQNFISAMSVSKYVLEIMQKQESGVIVNISSRYSVSGQFDAPAYAASKAAIVNLTQGQAKLMAPWGRANSISPGAVRAGYWLTAPQDEIDASISATPLAKFVEPEDVAEAVIFLASPKANMITGQNLFVDGGYSLK